MVKIMDLFFWTGKYHVTKTPKSHCNFFNYQNKSKSLESITSNFQLSYEHAKFK